MDGSWAVIANYPSDISIQWIKEMDQDFHARFKAQARRYRYVVYNNPQRPALLHKQVTHVYAKLDVLKMQRAAAKFEGTHNFGKLPCRSLSVQSARSSCQPLPTDPTRMLLGPRYSGGWLFTSHGA